MSGYLHDSDANLLQAIIIKKHLSWGSGWKLHVRFSLRQHKNKLFKDAYLNRVLLFSCRRALYNFVNVNFYVYNLNVCIAVAILAV